MNDDALPESRPLNLSFALRVLLLMGVWGTIGLGAGGGRDPGNSFSATTVSSMAVGALTFRSPENCLLRYFASSCNLDRTVRNKDNL
jgi:hypothetical protein